MRKVPFAWRPGLKQQLLLPSLFSHLEFPQPFTAQMPCTRNLYYFPEWPVIPVPTKTNTDLHDLFTSFSSCLHLFLLRHVCPDLFEEESPGGETFSWGKDSGLYPHHCSDSSKSSNSFSSLISISCFYHWSLIMWLYSLRLLFFFRSWLKPWWPWGLSVAGPPVTSTPLRMKWLLLLQKLVTTSINIMFNFNSIGRWTWH